MTPAAQTLAAAIAAASRKPAKYRSTRTTVDGIAFDSKREARRHGQLQLLLRAGAITDLERQVRFELAPSVRIEGEKRARPALRYFADFTYRQAGVLVVEDCKGVQTEAFRVKQHLMATVHGIHLRLVK